MSLNRPTAEELLQAAIDFIEQELVSGINDKALQYKTRVTLNVLHTIKREQDQKDSYTSWEIGQLQRLVDSDSQDLTLLQERLCEQINDQDADEACDKYIEFLRLSTLRKLAIDNPKYDTYRRLTG